MKGSLAVALRPLCQKLSRSESIPGIIDHGGDGQEKESMDWRFKMRYDLKEASSTIQVISCRYNSFYILGTESVGGSSCELHQ